MKVVHVCYSDLDGGAARAAYRLHLAQLKAGIDSYMLVVNKLSTDKRVISVGKEKRLHIRLNSFLSNILTSKLNKKNPVKHSLNVLPSGVLRLIDDFSADVINLHWIGSDMLSIGEIAKIKSPVVWTLHDMWAFSGCEHYDNYPVLERYKEQYKKRREIGWFDLNSIIFHYKVRKWKNKKITFVSPSNWLADCFRACPLSQGQEIQVIQNCIDHNIYATVDKKTARGLLGVPIDKKIVLFGAMASTSDPRKGFPLLDGALKILGRKGHNDLSLLVFGAEKKGPEQHHGLETYHLGILKDDLTLRLLYSAADVYVAPSLQDNLPNTLVESLAVGTPCVAFNIGGMPDLISNKNMGVLVHSIDEEALADGIERALNSVHVSATIRISSNNMRSEKVIAEQYKRVYLNV